MPEGDTIFRAARTLHRALADQPVTAFESVLPKLERVEIDTPITGRTIEKVEANGKWLLIYFSNNLILLTHNVLRATCGRRVVVVRRTGLGGHCGSGRRMAP